MKGLDKTMWESMSFCHDDILGGAVGAGASSIG